MVNKFVTEEKQLQLCGQQINQNNIPSKMIKEYWQRSIYLFFIDIAFTGMKIHFVKERRSHYGRCRFDPEFATEYDENKKNNANQCLAKKWDHVMLLPAYIRGKVIRWRPVCIQQQINLLSIKIIFKQHVDVRFSLNTDISRYREVFCS